MDIDLIELKKLIDLGHREYIVLLDYLRYVNGKIENITKIHEDIEKKYPKDKELYVELANYYIKNNDVYKAINCLEKYKKNGGDDTEILILLVEKYISVRFFDKSKQLLEDLKIKDDKNEKINKLLSNMEYIVLLDYLRYVNGKIENITKIHEDIEKKYPKDKELYVELANYYVNNSDVYKAIKCLEKYRENGGDNIEVLILLSKKYIDVKSFEKAKQLLEKLSIKNKANEEINNLLFSIKDRLKTMKIQNLEEKGSYKYCESDDIKEKINNIFEYSYDINVITKEIKDILITLNDNQNDILYDKISFFIQELNIQDRFEDVKYFFREIYDIVPNIKIKNILLNEYEIATKQIVLKSYPRRVRLELTRKCNVSCIMCKVRNNSFDMSDKEINDFLEVVPYIQELTIQGGEVFLDSRLKLIIDSVIKYNPKLTVITNGLLLNEFWLEKLSKTNIELFFSIDSQKKETYEKIRVGGNFERLINNVEMATKFLKNKKIILNMVVMKCNYKEIEDMIKFASKYGFYGIHLNPVDGDVCKEENFFSYKVDKNIINEIKNRNDNYEKLAKQYGIEILNRLPKKEKTCNFISKTDIKNIDKHHMYCYEPFKQLFVSGDLYAPSCECIGVINTVENLDNEKEHNIILKKWNGFVMREYRKAMIEHRENIVCKEICNKHVNSRRNIIKDGIKDRNE